MIHAMLLMKNKVFWTLLYPSVKRFDIIYLGRTFFNSKIRSDFWNVFSSLSYIEPCRAM